MISPTSRYRNSTVVKLKSIRGSSVPTITSGTQLDFVVTFTPHLVKAWERIDTIAFDYYQDDTQWWIIADANPEILKWDSLAPGTIIRIPNI